MEIIFLCVVKKNNKGNVNPRDFMVVFFYIYTANVRPRDLLMTVGFFKYTLDQVV